MMTLIPNRAVITVATMAICSLSATCIASAEPERLMEQGSIRMVQGSIRQLPFEPPVVHPGWSSDQQTWEQEYHESDRQRNPLRNLMFRPEDRKSFKALHPFLLHEPQKHLVEKKPRYLRPLVPNRR